MSRACISVFSSCSSIIWWCWTGWCFTSLAVICTEKKSHKKKGNWISRLRASDHETYVTLWKLIFWHVELDNIWNSKQQLTDAIHWSLRSCYRHFQFMEIESGYFSEIKTKNYKYTFLSHWPQVSQAQYPRRSKT